MLSETLDKWDFRLVGPIFSIPSTKILLKWDFNAMTSEEGDKKKFEFEDIALKKYKHIFEQIVEPFYGVCGLIAGCW